MNRKTPIPAVLMVVPLTWARGNKVRLVFSSGRIVDLVLPGRKARFAHVVDDGAGVDIGDGREASADFLHGLRGRVRAK